MKRSYSFNFSSGNQPGELILISQPASIQWVIENYQLQIGANRFMVFKYSETKVKLDPGKYKLKGWVRFFGLSTSQEIFIEPGKRIYYLFRGPLDMFTKGAFWQVEPQKM
jgi:hypothetical protein